MERKHVPCVKRRRSSVGALACLGCLTSVSPVHGLDARHGSLRRDGNRLESRQSAARNGSEGAGVRVGEPERQLCYPLGGQCGGMGFSPILGAQSLGCCNGLDCLEQDAFFSGCVNAAAADAAMRERATYKVLPQTSVTSKAQQQAEAHNYAEVLYMSILFYEAQRSGPLPRTNRVPWRQSSALGDKGLNDENLTGGWYDAGGYIKYTLPMAWSTTVLTWGLLEYWVAYQASGEVDHMLDCIRWPLDYFMLSHTGPDEFYVQIGDQSDYNSWGPPQVMPSNRPAYRVTCENPGTEPVAETAAAFAAGYLAFKDRDPEYAKKLLQHARELLDFGRRCQGNYVREGRLYVAEPYYTSYTGYRDELAWASLWLFSATGERAYLEDAKEEYEQCCAGPAYTAFTWDSKAPAVQLLLYKLTGDPKYSQDVSSFVNSWVGRQRTPNGLAYYAPSPNKYAAGASLIALMAADLGLMPDSYRSFAKSQIHYMLGGQRGPGEHDGFVVGYGERSAKAPHHRASSCPSQTNNSTCMCSTQPNYYTLYGALVGGPDANDAYVDGCPDFQANEVCTHCNAAFQSAVAGLKHLAMRGLLP